MSATDIIILLSIAIGIIRGFFRGFVKELAALVAILAGVYLSRHFSPALAAHFQSDFSMSATTSKLAAYLVIFLLITIVLLIVAHSLHKILDAISLGGVNKMLGSFFGGLKVLLIVSVLLNVYDAFKQRFNFDPLHTQQFIPPSKVYSFTLNFAPKLWDETQKINQSPDDLP